MSPSISRSRRQIFLTKQPSADSLTCLLSIQPLPNASSVLSPVPSPCHRKNSPNHSLLISFIQAIDGTNFAEIREKRKRENSESRVEGDGKSSVYTVTVGVHYCCCRQRHRCQSCYAAVEQIQGNSHLKALAAVYEVPHEPPASGGCCGGGGGGRGWINYEARVFLKEEVNALVRDAYVCYKIGQKLVEALYRDETTQETQESAGNETTQGTQ